ncbi:hypothetical protein QJS10_CPA05g01627 [Acorus calamus]|uniref:Endonuclease/exonuclease/phosphatase domain-containing protein n=1 Tax=Acorus calamus TaxID=4465 RepID=A0AAV9ERX1_ACOCL|nr:hypothetical protein QJS10_CPA05g01627 [Acorus calamus]
MSSGIIILWDGRKWKAVDRSVGEYSVPTLLECRQTGWKWACSSVYGPHEDAWREHLWEEISNICISWEAPWLVVGDFNVTRFPEDCNRPRPITPGMTRFSSWIDGEGLIDLPVGNQVFTWSNLREEPSLARLDRVLMDSEWKAKFPGCEVVPLPRVVSDHVPLLLKEGGAAHVPVCFCFEAWWLSVEGFSEVVMESWSADTGALQGGQRLAFKLK